MVALLRLPTREKQQKMVEVRAAGFLVFRILDSKILYLLLQSSRTPFHWTPPKGHVEAGETDLDAAYRETEEEAGLKRSQLRVFGDPITIKYTADGKPKIVTYWVAESTDPKADITISFEHKDFKWAEYEEASKLVKYETTVNLLAAGQEVIRKSTSK